MAILSKKGLSESASGRGLKIWSVSDSFPVLVHKVSCGSKDVQELWLWGYNESDEPAILYFFVTSSSGSKTDYCVELPPSLSKSSSFVSPGVVLKNGSKVEAYSSLSDKITIYGFVNQIDQTNLFANLVGAGENAYGQASHPTIRGERHEIKYDQEGNTIACGDQFTLALRPNGSVFGWGVGNLTTQLLITGGNAPWLDSVDIYSATDNVIVSSDGIPPHQTPYKDIHAPNPPGNPHKASAQNHYFLVPRNIEVTGQHGPPIPRGNVGVAVDGIPFDIRTAEIWSGMNSWEEAGGPGDLGIDSCGGHVQPNGKYHYHLDPRCLHTADTGQHSPIIGYAFDGLPIYGPVGYANTGDSAAGVSVMESSYRVKQGNRPYGSGVGPGGAYDGTYTADYEFISGLGDLDEANARFAITPENSTGSWHYHITATGISSNFPGISVYPYSVGPVFKGVPTECNFSGTCSHPVVFPPRNLKNLKKIRVGNDHAIALTSLGSAIAWGGNTFDQCHVPATLNNGVVDVDAGGDHSLAIQAGQVVAWGNNDLGQATGVPTTRSVGEVSMISEGANYVLPPSIAIEGGGDGAGGASGIAVLAGRGILSIQLEAGGALYTGPPTVVFSGGGLIEGGWHAQVAASLTSDSENPAYGYVSALTITDSGHGYVFPPSVHFVDNNNACTGFGICGTGATATAYLQSTSVSGVIVQTPGEGYYLDPVVTFTNSPSDTAGAGAAASASLSGIQTGLAFPVQGMTEVSKVVAGSKHNIALYSTGLMFAWGDSSYGQLAAPFLVPDREVWRDIACGANHAVGVVYDGTNELNYVAAWGDSTFGQVNVPQYARSSVAQYGAKTLKVEAGANYSLILNPDGTTTGFGGITIPHTENINSFSSGPVSDHAFFTTNEIYEKQPLSSSDDGEAIVVADGILPGSTCSSKTHIHRTKDIPNGVEELWLWAYNGGTQSANLELYLEPKETSSVSSVEIIDSGDGYDTEPTIIISGGGGQGAIAASTISMLDLEAQSAYLDTVVVTYRGSGYLYPPAVLVTGGVEDVQEFLDSGRLAICKSHIETGQKIDYILPPKTSGLHLLSPGMKLENLYNIRATASDSNGQVPTGNDAIGIFGYVIRQEKGLEGESLYYDNPYQVSGALTCPPIAQLTSSVSAGGNTLQANNYQGFYPSEEIVIDPYGQGEETASVSSLSSLIIVGAGTGDGNTGTKYNHAIGEWIVDKAFYDLGVASVEQPSSATTTTTIEPGGATGGGEGGGGTGGTGGTPPGGGGTGGTPPGGGGTGGGGTGGGGTGGGGTMTTPPPGY